MRRLIALILAAVLALLALPGAPALAAGEARKHALLIDGSGSMEDPAAQMFMYSSGKVETFVRRLVEVEGAFQAHDEIAIGVFSKTDKDRGVVSPVWLYKGTVAKLRSGWPGLKHIGGWTDLVGALDAGVNEVKSHKGPELVWLLTDNIDQAADTTDSTEQFYLNLAGRNDLHRIHVFPVDLSAPQGLVMYGLVRDRGEQYRQADGQALDQAVAAVNSSPLKPLLGDGGFLVHPLAEQAFDVKVVDFVPDPQVSPGARFSVDPQTGAIRLSGFAEGKPVRGQFKVELTSRFPALKIEDATISAELGALSSGDFYLPKTVAQKISPTKVSLEPGQKAEYTVDIEIEPPLLIWNPLEEPAGALEDEGTIRGDLKLVVRDVTFKAVQPDKFFKVQQIPEILGNRSRVIIPLAAPVTVHVALPWWRLGMLFGILLAFIGLLWALYAGTVGRKRTVRAHSLHFDTSGVVSLSRKLVVPGYGFFRMNLLGGLEFVADAGPAPAPAPAKGKGKAAARGRVRKLRAPRGEIKLDDNRSFFYEVGTKAKNFSAKGGTQRDRTPRYY